MSNDSPDKSAVVARLGTIVFDKGSYDPLTDVLVLTRGEATDATSHITPEGHELHLDPGTGEVMGLTVRGYQAALFDGPIEVTLPGPHEDDPMRATRPRLWMSSLYGGMCC